MADGGKPWCSTKIDPLDYQHVGGQGFYGDCQNVPQCPNVGGFNPRPAPNPPAATTTTAAPAVAGKHKHLKIIPKIHGL